MSVPILYTIDAGTSTGYRLATLDEIMAGARDALNRRVRKGVALTSPQLTRDYLTAKLATREFETFCCLFLDNRHRVIDFVELFRGTIDGALYLASRPSIARKCL
jgi:DNA repair protein RadC